MYKMVILVNSGLKMSIGKTTAQVGHGVARNVREAPFHRMKLWDLLGKESKIVLDGGNTDELLKMAQNAEDNGLTVNLVKDAGLTEIPPGSVSVVAIGPNKIKDIDKITGNLKLL